MAAADDTTVYTISAGYLPSLAFKRGDFKPKKEFSGQARESIAGRQKYDGTQISLGKMNIGRDGSMVKARIRGSIGWYEFSTTIRAINEGIISTDDLLKEQLKRYAEEWYRVGNSHKMNEELLNTLSGDMKLNWSPSPSKEQDEMKGGRGKKKLTGSYGTPEEQGAEALGITGAKDVQKEAQADLIGRANAVDLYMTNPVTGDIERYDVTAMTMSTKGAHHGLSNLDDRLKKNVDGASILKLIKEGGGFGIGSPAQKKYLDYFKSLQETNWNPKIQALRGYIEKSGSENARKILRDLVSKRSDLKQEGQNAKDLLKEMRPEFGEAAMRASPSYKREMQAKIKEYGKDWVMENTNKRRFAMYQAFKNQAHGETFESGLSFVLHALGNIVNHFAKGNGSYRTFYSLGTGEAGNFVVEVVHRVHASGASVFEFKDMANRHVQIHNEATASAVLIKRFGLVQAQTSNSVLENLARYQNEEHAAYALLKGGAAVELGTICGAFSMGAGVEGGSILHRSSSVITPKSVNADIETFIDTMMVNREGIKKAEKMLKPNIKNMYEESPAKYADFSVVNPNIEGGEGFGRGFAQSYKSRMYRFDDRSQRLGKTDRNNIQQYGTTKIGGSNRNMPEASQADIWGDIASNPAALFGKPKRTGRYWGLDAYLRNTEKEGFKGTVTPQFWAVPYLSIMYPSTQVQVSKKD
jgi:hypothetical protein